MPELSYFTSTQDYFNLVLPLKIPPIDALEAQGNIKKYIELTESGFFKLPRWPSWRPSISIAAMLLIDKSPRAAHNSRKTFCRANDSALPFSFSVINGTVARFTFSFFRCWQNVVHCTSIEVFCHQTGRCWFVWLPFFRAELSKVQLPFLPLARRSLEMVDFSSAVFTLNAMSTCWFAHQIKWHCARCSSCDSRF